MVQAIPDIHEIFKDHVDLIEVMDTLLHFGDTPPKLSKLIVDASEHHKDTLLGFCNNYLDRKKYIKKRPETIFSPSDTIYGTYQFLFDNQHRGVSSLRFRCTNHDEGPNNHFYEDAKLNDSVFIMGTDPWFTVYYYQNRKKHLVVNGFVPNDPGAKEAVILSGKVTENGVRDFYIGIKVYDYDDPSVAGMGGFDIGDIVVYHKDFLPFTYWDTIPKYTN